MGEQQTPCHQIHFTGGTMFLQVFTMYFFSLKNITAHFFICQVFVCD